MPSPHHIMSHIRIFRYTPLAQAMERATRGSAVISGGTRSYGVRFPRGIVHPQYKNFTHLEAEKYLKEVRAATHWNSHAHASLALVCACKKLL